MPRGSRSFGNLSWAVMCVGKGLHVNDITHIWNAILDALKEMGAASVREGKPYGLRGYPDYHRERQFSERSFRKSAWEEPLTDGIRLGLACQGLCTTTERRYPANPQERCDLVVDLCQSGLLWIECKTAFRQCLGKAGWGSPYDYDYDGDDWYDPGKGRDSWVAGVRDIVEKDVPKLLSLTSNEAQHVGVLLLGFDLRHAPLTNQELYGLLGPSLDEWKPLHDSKEGVTWKDSYSVRAERGFRERVWFWCRPVAEHAPRQTVGPNASAASGPEGGAKRIAALTAVARFCSVPYKQHGGLQKSGPYEGWYKHDWGHLVQEVNTIYGANRLSIFGAWNVGNQIRRRFANVYNWDAAVNAPGAHEMILDIILRAIMPDSGTNMS